MSDSISPYVTHCSRCGNGQLRLYRCGQCGTVVAICDECELVWENVARVSSDPRAPSDASFPACPHCRSANSTWIALDIAAIRGAGLEGYLTRESDGPTGG